MSKKLFSFDFDSTLIMTPLEEEGKLQWESVTGKKWQWRGWWANPESLNLDIFKPITNDWVLQQFTEASRNENDYLFVATGRINKLYNFVKAVLTYNEITQRKEKKLFGYDDLFCNTGGDTFTFKCNLFEKIISENPDADEFIMYDDREEHLEKFCEWAKKQSIKIKIYNVNLKKQIF